MREAFENALLENPDDLAAWCAFADYLADHDDPRGTFMQIQLALEDGSRSRDERDALKPREAELLAAHEREWLGDLAPYLLDRDGSAPHTEHWWARGFLTELRVERLSYEFASALAKAPAARMLRALRIEDVEVYDLPDDLPSHFAGSPWDFERVPHLKLLRAPWLAGLRSFQMGETADHGDDPTTGDRVPAPGLEELVTHMPRVEELQLLCTGYDAAALFELPNLTNLQVLRTVGLGDGDGPPVPLGALARNPALANLTHLLVHPNPGGSYLPLAQVQALVNSPHLTGLTHLQLRLSDMGDAGAAAIVGSGILRRLGWLDLRNGAITDQGARLFAGSADAKRLRRLDLSRNPVTQAGLGALTRAGVNAVAKTVWSRRELDEHEARVRRQPGYYDPDDDGREGDME